MAELTELEQSIGYVFKNKEILKNALMHKSYANENSVTSNEKLEFLGDAILEFLSSKYLYRMCPDLAEGELTKVRADIVCEASLYQVAVKHNISEHLFLGKSEIASGGNQKEAILADSVEALIAAMYFDSQGLEVPEKFIIDNLAESAKTAWEHVGEKDHKTVLQEKLQANGEVTIEYRIIKEEGPDHDKLFTSEVFCNGESLAVGTGKSKKEAEQEAANNYLKTHQD